MRNRICFVPPTEDGFFEARTYPGTAIKGMVTTGGVSLDFSKLINLIILGSLCVHEALGDMLTSIVSNFHFGKRPGA